MINLFGLMQAGLMLAVVFYTWWRIVYYKGDLIEQYNANLSLQEFIKNDKEAKANYSRMLWFWISAIVATVFAGETGIALVIIAILLIAAYMGEQISLRIENKGIFLGLFRLFFTAGEDTILASLLFVYAALMTLMQVFPN